MNNPTSCSLLAALLASACLSAPAQRLIPVVDTNGLLLSPSPQAFAAANSLVRNDPTNVIDTSTVIISGVNWPDCNTTYHHVYNTNYADYWPGESGAYLTLEGGQYLLWSATDDCENQCAAADFPAGLQGFYPTNLVAPLTYTLQNKAESADLDKAVNDLYRALAAALSRVVANSNGAAANLSASGSFTYTNLPDQKLIEIAAGPSYQQLTMFRNAAGVVTNAAVLWPDGTYGTFTTLSNNAALLSIDSFSVSYTNRNRLIIQPLVLRNSNGFVTNKPALIITNLF